MATDGPALQRAATAQEWLPALVAAVTVPNTPSPYRVPGLQCRPEIAAAGLAETPRRVASRSTMVAFRSFDDYGVRG